MRLGVLFSGGKDSCLAVSKAIQHDDVVCLVSLISKNKESYMFHTPNNALIELQAKAIGLPLVLCETDGQKEIELQDLKGALAQAKDVYRIEGVVSGAVASIYQSSRIQRVCAELDLWCFNPLWQRNQISILQELIDKKFSVIIAGVFAEPLGREWLGKELDERMIGRLQKLERSHQLNPAGEGGEIETTVVDAPIFSSKIKIDKAVITFEDGAGTYDIAQSHLVGK